jgi:hypothetical protein
MGPSNAQLTENEANSQSADISLFYSASVADKNSVSLKIEDREAAQLASGNALALMAFHVLLARGA